ncbi:hypothetical protein I6M42_14940 [Shewanella algae]|uniref:polymorphic toxin-type HINT domain-containing protein n=1 Tax=Shewanella algae TaxID=38313 RepID=UPI001AAE8C28|nr:polymorphic toxin-type HINT domain-containing protein [Shewanella algae]MBO2637925.1 hypothetical protein [Shewanella algae]
MGSARLASIHELYLSDAPQIESAWRQWSDDDLKDLVPPGRSLSHVKQQLENGDALLLSDSPKLPLFTAQQNDFSLPVSGGDIPATAVKHIQQRFATAGSSAHFKAPNGSLHPAIEPNYTPDTRVTQIAPDKPLPVLISPKFAQARRRLELELVYDDKEETAAGKVPYRVEFSDGSQKSGVLNAKGWACLEDCPNGEATVIFGDEAERQSAEQRLPSLYRQLAASLDTAAAEMAKKSEQLAAQADVQQISDSFRQKVDAQLAELTAQREQFNQQQIWQQALQTGQAYTQGLSQGTASFMDDLLDFSGLMAFLEEAEISLSLLLEAIMTGDVDALESQLAQWRARGENGLKATGEAMEMLILLLKDEYVRALLQSLPLRYLDALPKDKLAEIAGYMHSRVSLDGMLEMSLILLAALVGSIFGVILMFLVVTKRRASRIISPASSVLEDIAKAQKAVRNDHAVQTYIGKHQTPLNSKTPKGDVDTPLKSQENEKGVPNNQSSLPAGAQSVQSRISQGKTVPPHALENPDAYYYDTNVGKYKSIPEPKPDFSQGTRNREIPCFGAGTLVATPDSFILIENVEIGDIVSSWDEKHQKVVANRVTALHRNRAIEWVEMVVSGETITSTRNHRFWVPKNNEWIEAKLLSVGMEVQLENGQSAQIDKVKFIDSPEKKETFNIMVENAHTYFVGERKVLVHNQGSETSGKIYIGYNKSGTPIYVGQTLQTIKARQAQHFAEAKADPTKWGWKSEMTIIKVPGMDGLTPDQMNYHERRIYDQYLQKGYSLKNSQIPLTDSKVNKLLNKYC